VSHTNVLHYVDAMVDRYDIDEHDRVSQTHDLTFDVSVFDLFVTWDRGACVCCPGQRTMLNPGRYVRDARLSVWFSVPSVAMFMRRLGSLKPDSYPDLRWSLFAGEPLPVEVVRAWELAAPGSIVENLYGPTEATVVCALYSWDPHTSPDECERGLLPIGRPLENLGMLIVDEQLHEVRPGEQGELLVSGPQVTLGYWRDAEKTAAAFVVPPGLKGVHYRTGDVVRRPRRADGPIAFMGRRDQQVKIRGVRIELGEIESALRDASGVDAVAALGWPTTLVGADAVEAFVGSDDIDVVAIRAALAKRLPVHMVPRRVRALAQLPLNANGKIDRAALVKLLESE
jgi:non-ribosomal peptide synthetase component F